MRLAILAFVNIIQNILIQPLLRGPRPIKVPQITIYTILQQPFRWAGGFCKEQTHEKMQTEFEISVLNFNS